MAVPAAHRQLPPTQIASPVHRFPQLPQWLVSDFVSTHCPEHSVSVDVQGGGALLPSPADPHPLGR
jgi:hypothetical protein